MLIWSYHPMYPCLSVLQVRLVYFLTSFLCSVIGQVYVPKIEGIEYKTSRSLFYFMAIGSVVEAYYGVNTT